MKNLNTILAVSLLAVAGSMFAGCTTSSAPDADEGTAIVVDELGAAPIDSAVQLQMGQRPDGSVGILGDSIGRPVAPGVWDVETEDGIVHRIFSGEDGHRWLIEQTEAQLNDLYDRLNAGTGDEDELTAQITAAEDTIAMATETVKNTAGPGFLPPAVTCNIALYTGPITGSGLPNPPFPPPGGAALAQIVCSGGCAAFTVQSQVCCSAGCTAVNTATNAAVCATPWTAGTILFGTGAGAAAVVVVGIVGKSSTFTCQ